MDSIPTSYLVSYSSPVLSCAGTSHVTSSTKLLQYYGVGVEDTLWCSRELKYLVCCSTVVMQYYLLVYMLPRMLSPVISWCSCELVMYISMLTSMLCSSVLVCYVLYAVGVCTCTCSLQQYYEQCVYLCTLYLYSVSLSLCISGGIHLTSCCTVSHQLLEQSYSCSSPYLSPPVLLCIEMYLLSYAATRCRGECIYLLR